MIPFPTLMPFSDWADQLSLEMEDTVPIVKYTGEPWQEWAVEFINSGGLSQLPDPIQFTDWRTWADSVVEILN